MWLLQLLGSHFFAIKMCGILKIQQTSECNTKKQALREHTGSYQWGEKEEEGHYRGRGLRGYTAKHKEFSQDFFNNHEWSIIFKIFESLCFTSEMCIIL